MDGMLGKELELLVGAVERGFIVTTEEAERVRGRYVKIGPDAVNPKQCDGYMSRRSCRFGQDCHFIHMIEESSCGPGDSVYAGFLVGVR